MSATDVNPPRARFVFAITTWGTALRRCRVDADLSYRDLADFVGVSKGIIKLWERGDGYPSAQQIKRLYGRGMYALKTYEHLLPKSNQEAVAAAPAEAGVPEPVGLPPRVQEIDEPRTFGAALRLARQVEGLHQHEVGELVGVQQSAISRWELDGDTPVQENYDKLVTIFDVLRDGPRPPNVRAIAKPVGPLGMRFEGKFEERAASTRSDLVFVPPALPPVVVASPLTPAEEAGLRYARLLVDASRTRELLAAARIEVTEKEATLKRQEAAVEAALATVRRIAAEEGR